MEIQEIASLKPGGIYILQCKHQIRREDFELIQSYLKSQGDGVGCKFILLSNEFELVKPIEVNVDASRLVI